MLFVSKFPYVHVCVIVQVYDAYFQIVTLSVLYSLQIGTLSVLYTPYNKTKLKLCKQSSLNSFNVS